MKNIFQRIVIKQQIKIPAKADNQTTHMTGNIKVVSLKKN